MGFLNSLTDRISVSNISTDERTLIVNVLKALDDDLVEGGYDPQPPFIDAYNRLEAYLFDREVSESMEDDDADEPFDALDAEYEVEEPPEQD